MLELLSCILLLGGQGLQIPPGLDSYMPIPEENPLDYDASPLTQYSGYTVYTEDGHKVAYEENHGVRLEGPVDRRLAPGRYFVRLDEPAPGREFWVTVERGRVTRVENRLWSGAPPDVK